MPLDRLADPSRLDPRVVSLVKNLPVGPEIAILPCRRPVYYIYADRLLRNRNIDRGSLDPLMLGDRGVKSNALWTVLILFEQLEDDDPTLGVDVSDSKS